MGHVAALTRARRFSRGLYAACIFGLVVFPWLYALVPPELRLKYWVLLPLAGILDVVGIGYLAAWLTIFVHEAGHWFFGRCVGIRLRDFVVGDGPPTWRFTWRGVRLVFGAWPRWGYVCERPARQNLEFRRQLVFLAGGMVAELGLLAVLFLLPNHDAFVPWIQPVIRLRWTVLAVVGLTVWATAWPRLVWIEGERVANDGLLIRRAWWERRRGDELWREREALAHVAAYVKQQDYTAAAAALERMLDSDAPDPSRLRELGALYAGSAQYERAFTTYDRALGRWARESPEWATTLDVAASLALEIGHTGELLRLRPLLEDALRIHGWPTLTGTLGSALVELGETIEGVRLLNQCIAKSDMDHDVAIANAYLAKAAFRMGRCDRARELLRWARKRGGDHALVQRVAQELEPRLWGPQAAAFGDGAS